MRVVLSLLSNSKFLLLLLLFHPQATATMVPHTSWPPTHSHRTSVLLARRVSFAMPVELPTMVCGANMPPTSRLQPSATTATAAHSNRLQVHYFLCHLLQDLHHFQSPAPLLVLLCLCFEYTGYFFHCCCCICCCCCNVVAVINYWLFLLSFLLLLLCYDYVLLVLSTLVLSLLLFS